MDIAVIIRSSATLGAEDYSELLQFTSNVIQNANVGEDSTRIAFLTAGEVPSLIFNFREAFVADELSSLVLSTPHPAGDGDLAAALLFADRFLLNQGSGRRAGVPTRIVVVSDAHDNDESGQLAQAAAKLRDKAAIIAVGVGWQMSPGSRLALQLQSLASTPDEVVFIPEFSAASANQFLYEALFFVDSCFQPPPVGSALSHVCNFDSDVLLLLDGSENIGLENFNRLTNFAVSLLDDFAALRRRVRVFIVLISAVMFG